MPNLLESIHDLLKKAGAKEESLKGFINKFQHLGKEDLDEETANAFNSLMSIEAAVVHPDVNKKVRGEVYRAYDKTVLERAKRLLPEEKYKAIESESNSFERNKLFADALEEQTKEASKKSNGSEEIVRLNNENASLKQLINDVKKAHQSEVQQVRQEYHQKEVRNTFGSWARGQKLVKHILDDPDGIELVRMKIDRELQKYPGATYDIDQNGSLVFGKRGENGLEDYYDPSTNRKIDWPEFSDRVLATNNLIAVSDPNQHTGAGQPGQPPVVIPGQQAATPKKFSVAPQ